MLVQGRAQQGLVQGRGPGADQPGALAAVLPAIGGAVGDEACAGVVAAMLEEVALGKRAFAVVIAQLAVGERHDFPARRVVPEHRAARQRRGHRKAEVIEDRGGQVDMAVGA
ncbi:hypothetical protein D3C76_1406070 [compost metagenome]